MQKISSYLYPNRINVVADLALFPVRWSIVYQNRIKIYKGVDNLLTIDVKNSDQKRIDISSMTLKMSIKDTAGIELLNVPIIASSTQGLATVNIPADDLQYFSHQFLNFTIYRENLNLTKTVLYADTQFGVDGNMEIVGTALSKKLPIRYITRFLSVVKDIINLGQVTDYVSDAVEIVQPNWTKNPTDEAIIFTFEPKQLHADVTIQFTKDSVIGSATDWENIETFEIQPSVSSIAKMYTFPTYDREYTWARVTYKLTNNSVGKISKIYVSWETIDQLTLDGGVE